MALPADKSVRPLGRQTGTGDDDLLNQLVTQVNNLTVSVRLICTMLDAVPVAGGFVTNVTSTPVASAPSKIVAMF